MTFFDQLSSKLSQTSQSAVQKTKDMAEVVRLNGQISERERRMEQLYREMGKRYYEQCAGRDEELFRTRWRSCKASRRRSGRCAPQSSG